MSREAHILPELVEGNGLTLRRWKVADAQAISAAVEESAEHLRPWMPWMAEEPLTLRQRRAMHAKREHEWAEGGDVMLAVFAGDRVVGSCGLKRSVCPNALEIGYWIHPACIRRGLATEVARLLIGAAFAVPGIEHVEIHHDKANQASAGISVKLGFRFVGETPDEPAAPGEVGVECIWRMEKGDWEDGGEITPAVLPR